VGCWDPTWRTWGLGFGVSRCEWELWELWDYVGGGFLRAAWLVRIVE
jgi:hypothetical protein